MGKRQENLHRLVPDNSGQMPTIPETSQNPWLKAIDILQQVHDDYALAKDQLGSICLEFTEKEAATRQHLSSLIPALKETSSLIEKSGTASTSNTENPTGKAPCPTNSLRAYCLGNFEVMLNWRKYDRWHSLKAKSLLKYLVVHKNRPVPKEVLIETLWPECDPESGNNNLKSAVYALRQMFTRDETETNIDSPIIVFSEGQYAIDSKLLLWVDVDEFESNWLTGRHLEKINEVSEALKHYQLAEELYRGDYLEDEPYAEWTLLRREALKDTYLAVLTKLANSSFQVGDYENCIVYSQKILAKDSCSEEAYQWLMRCYSRLGQRHRAQQWFNLCVRTLKKELDSAPNRRTISFHKRLADKEPI